MTMKGEVYKWFNNADSPVLFMVDDLANVWVDVNGNGEIDPGEDWGYAKYSENSSFRFLNDVILKNYPYIKVTFFTPVGVRAGMIENPAINSILKMINSDDEAKQFFRSINDNPRYEIAYHGTTHGRVGKTSCDFVQEWETFSCLEEAEDAINKGKEIYIDVFGEYPRGGKYCGYASNEFSDESINNAGFTWWCRYWNGEIIDSPGCRTGGNVRNSLENLDIKVFGSNKVIDIPSTVSGALLTGILNFDMYTIKGIGKKLLKKYLIRRKLEQIDFLLKNKLVISIQEHIAPARDDGRIQMPNIYNDRESLKIIFEYLRDKNVWYCTCSELADYVIFRDGKKTGKKEKTGNTRKIKR